MKRSKGDNCVTSRKLILKSKNDAQFKPTGARVLGNAASILKENGGGRCLISVCTAGGMGTAAIIEL